MCNIGPLIFSYTNIPPLISNNHTHWTNGTVGGLFLDSLKTYLSTCCHGKVLLEPGRYASNQRSLEVGITNETFSIPSTRTQLRLQASAAVGEQFIALLESPGEILKPSLINNQVVKLQPFRLSSIISHRSTVVPFCNVIRLNRPISCTEVFSSGLLLLKSSEGPGVLEDLLMSVWQLLVLIIITCGLAGILIWALVGINSNRHRLINAVNFPFFSISMTELEACA